MSMTRARCIALLISCSYPAVARAQTDPAQLSPPTFPYVDENSVDLTTGRLALKLGSISIGPNGPGGLGYIAATDKMAQRPEVFGYIDVGSPTYLVVTGGTTVKFTLSGTLTTGSFSPDVADGSTLSYDPSGNYTYTSRDGTVFVFQGGSYRVPLRSITFANGVALSYYYYSQPTSILDPVYYDEGLSLKTIMSTLGYQLWLDYSTAVYGSNTYGYVSKARAINNATEICDPAATTCSTTANWPALTISGFGGTVTDNLGHTTTIVTGGYSGTWQLTYPSGRQASYTVTPTTVGGISSYDVHSYSDGRGTWTYNYAVPGAVTLRFGPDHSAPYIYQFVTGGISYFANGSPGSPTYTYSYDTQNRLKTVQDNSGLTTQYTYDARGNVTRKETTSATPGTPPNIVLQATYPTTCTNIKTCNKATYVIDARNQQTDYTYDPASGYVTSVTAPAATAGGLRGETIFTYQTQVASYKNLSGFIGAWQPPVVMQTGSSTCQTQGVSSPALTLPCAGTADEVRTTTTYGPQNTGVANNLLPVTFTTAAGDGSLSATTARTYDDAGHVLTVDGPLPGTADTTRYRYDAVGQLIGTVQPDPDGTGPRTPKATRLTYTLDGQLQLAETGTVADQSDAAWAAFSSAQQMKTSYDGQGRPYKSELQSGATTYAVTNQDYTAGGIPTCTATRMDPATYASLPASACTAAASSDRIVQYGHDNYDRVTTVTEAVGTPGAAVTSTRTYDAVGRLSTIKDGENNLTTYEYDGFGRLQKTRYPVPTQGAASSSTTDYEQLDYDPSGNITSRRLRDGTSVGFSYDFLNNLVTKTPPGTEPATNYSYDMIGRMTLAAQPTAGITHTLAWDALSELKSESQPFGTITYKYDQAGHRRLIGWSDGLIMRYDLSVLGEVTAIRENGASSGPGVLATYTYDNLGRRTGVTWGNGTTTSYGYDPVSRLASLSHDLLGSSYDFGAGFSYNPAGQITSTTRTNDVYAYSGLANMNKPYTVNGLNQATSSNGYAIAYDTRGNLNSAAGVAGTSTYGYNSANLMTSASGGVTLHYDAFNRLNEYDTAVSTRYVFDVQNVVSEVNTSGAIQRRYVYSPGDDVPVVWYEGSGTSDRRWLHTDERGSVVAVSDGSGAAIAVNSYDEYGVPASGNIGRFQYTGQAWLPELQLYDYKARMYASRLGRFMQTDPIGYGNGINWYNYVGGDPVNYKDPSGTETHTAGGAFNPTDDPCGGGQCVIDIADIVVTATRDHGLTLADMTRMTNLDLASRLNLAPEPPQPPVGAGPGLPQTAPKSPCPFAGMVYHGRGGCSTPEGDKDRREKLCTGIERLSLPGTLIPGGGAVLLVRAGYVVAATTTAEVTALLGLGLGTIYLMEGCVGR